jgi:NADPH:quinone reductase
VRRVVCRGFGPPERLVLEDAPDPRPGPGEVLVRVRAAGVSFVDGLIVAGLYQVKPPLPFTPGWWWPARWRGPAMMCPGG